MSRYTASVWGDGGTPRSSDKSGVRPHEVLVACLAERFDGYRLLGMFHRVFWLFVPDRGLAQTFVSPHEHLAQLGAFQGHPRSLLTQTGTVRAASSSWTMTPSGGTWATTP